MDAQKYADGGAMDQLALAIQSEAEAADLGFQPVPSLLTEEERTERIMTMLATEGFDRMDSHDVARLADGYGRGLGVHPDYAQGLREEAAKLLAVWHGYVREELSHLWNMQHLPKHPWYGNKDLTDEDRRTLYDLFAWLDSDYGTAYYSEQAKDYARWASRTDHWRDPQFIEDQIRLLAKAPDYASLITAGLRPTRSLASDPFANMLEDFKPFQQRR